MHGMRGLLIGIAALTTAGCVGSVNPIVAEDTARFAPGLIGSWADSDSKESAEIARRGEHGYTIRYTNDKGETLALDGILGRSDGRYILDVQPTAAALGAYNDLVVRLHIPLVLDAIGPRIHLAVLEPDSLDRYLRSHPTAVHHGRTNDGVVLTADTPELEKFFAAYLKRPGAIAAPSTWVRRAP